MKKRILMGIIATSLIMSGCAEINEVSAVNSTNGISENISLEKASSALTEKESNDGISEAIAQEHSYTEDATGAASDNGGKEDERGMNKSTSRVTGDSSSPVTLFSCIGYAAANFFFAYIAGSISFFVK